jgi:hypothetical protein
VDDGGRGGDFSATPFRDTQKKASTLNFKLALYNFFGQISPCQVGSRLVFSFLRLPKQLQTVQFSA